MFTARGLGFVLLPNGAFQVSVEFVEDATGMQVLKRTFVAADKPTLVTQVRVQLQQLKQAATDAQVNLDIVGKVLGTI